MFFKKKKNGCSCENLKSTIESLKIERDSLKKKIELMNDSKKIIEQNSSCSFEIDFEKMNVVAIERYTDGIVGNTKTVIGYKKDTEDKIKEYDLYCNIDQHEILVKKFQEYMDKK